MHKYNNMAFCQRQEAKGSSQSGHIIGPKVSKYSLKDHCFRQKKTYSQKKAPSSYYPLVSSRFAQFISQHNNTLLTRNGQEKEEPPQERTFFDCFQTAHSVLRQESALASNKISHRYTISTLSSSSLSEKAGQKHYSNYEDERVTTFRINTKSIMSELLQNSQYRQDTLREEESSFHIDLHSSRIDARRSKKYSERNSSRKSRKVSLKN